MKQLFILLSVLALTVSAAAQDMKSALSDLKKTYAPDARNAVWNVEAIEHYNAWELRGVVDNNEFKQLILDEAKKLGVNTIDSIKVLENSCKYPWAIVKLSAVFHRTSNDHDAPTATQSQMGTPVKVLQYDGGWYRVQTPDKYISYVPWHSLELMSESQFQAWKKSTRYIVTAYQTHLVAKPGSDENVSDLVLGNILQLKEKKGKWLKLSTPDGREGYVRESEMKELKSWANQSFDAKKIEKIARWMMGSTYTWGGSTTKGVDCSGLVRLCYYNNGIITHRDASQLALLGKKIEASDWKSAKAGDLLFFGSKKGKVTHVAIYLRDGKYIHSSGRVKINSVNPEDEDHLTTPFLSISRIDGEIGTKGITYLRDHDWYFAK